VRKLIKSLLTVSILIPSLGLAVGLGDIHLRSNLNQQLVAEVDLLSVEPSEADKITASLASYEDFNKLGLDRPAVLMFLQFEVLKHPDGTPYIKIKSKEAINEPFLDFLVEVTWPSGKMLREYTLLLDPPSMSSQQEPLLVQTPQVEETPAAGESPQTALPVQEPVVSAPVDMTSAPVTEEPQTTQATPEQQQAIQEQPAAPQVPEAQVSQAAQETPAGAAAPATQTATAQPAPEQTTGRWPEDKAPVEPTPVSSESLSYGPVKRNETLYRIANKMRPDESVSVEQMMIALYNSNREAFTQNNINRLRKGAVLRIEDPATLHALSQAEARRQVARHGRAWEEYRSKIAARTPKSVPAEAAPAESMKAGGAVSTKEESKLTLVAPSKPGEAKQSSVGGTSEKGGDAESLRKELLLANESAEARRKENEELNKRLKELEGQLEQMQKLLTLKDDNLAAMQQKLAAQQKEAATSNNATASATPAQPASQVQTPMVEPSKAPEVSTAAGTASTPTVEGQTAATAPATGEGAAPAPQATAPEAAKPAETDKPKPAPKRPKPVLPPPPPEPGLVDQLLGDPVMLGGALAGVIVLVLGIVLLMRKRRQGRGFQESILTVGATSSMMKGKGDNPASETSFLSDLAISGMGGRVQEESDVDPLTEADVYMAYNRFPQAEELLKEGLKHNPERDELHAKLLEVYYKSKNRKAFEEVAEARSASMQRNQSMWQKVVAMGHELAPNNPLFTGAVAAGTTTLLAESSAASPAANEVFDIGLDLDALSNEMEAAGAGSSDFVDLGLDFSDLGMDEGDKKKPNESVATAPSLDFDLGETAEAAAQTAESPSFDFDLSSFGGGTDSAPSVSAEAVQAEERVLGGLDFDLSSMAEESPVTEEPAASLDFGDFDLGSVAAAEAPTNEQESTFDLGSLDFGSTGSDLSVGAGSESIEFGDLDLGGGTEEPAMDLADLGDFGDLGDLGGASSLGDMDEVGTKLDLAKAYVDMGDADGARGMLEEVLAEGSDEQKRQAKELLSQIA